MSAEEVGLGFPRLDGQLLIEVAGLFPANRDKRSERLQYGLVEVARDDQPPARLADVLGVEAVDDTVVGFLFMAAPPQLVRVRAPLLLGRGRSRPAC